MSEAKPKLVPCPFCGGEAREDAHADDCYFVLHRKLNEQPAADMTLHLEVLDAWNRRSGQFVERVKELEAVVRALIAYDESDHEDGVQMMLDYADMLKGAYAALSKARPNTAEGEVKAVSQPAPVLDSPHARRFGGCPSCGRSDCVAMSCTRGNSDELLCIETIKKQAAAKDPSP